MIIYNSAQNVYIMLFNIWYHQVTEYTSTPHQNLAFTLTWMLLSQEYDLITDHWLALFRGIIIYNFDIGLLQTITFPTMLQESDLIMLIYNF